jgi:uncharacterized NAD(P)/FAD-binding protein YdhS
MGAHLAIIGGGFSGAVLALETRARGGCATVIDKAGAFGRGLAYSTKDPAHLLNVPAGRMSVMPDAPDDFVAWLRGVGRAFNPIAVGPNVYVPRHIYGAYLEERLCPSREQEESSAIRLVQGEAVGIEIRADEVCIALADGDSIVADAAVLATGHSAPRAPIDIAELSPGVYINDPWSADLLDAIKTSADVLFIGAGLTMIDVAQSLMHREHRGRMLALSRHGLTPLPQHELAALDPTPLQLPLSVSHALRALRQEAHRAQGTGGAWQDVMNRARHIASAHWQRMSLDQKARFLRHARSWWEVHRHRAGPEASQLLQTLLRSGRLRVIAGKIVDATMLENRVTLQYRPRGKDDLDCVSVDVIVNCTGAGQDPQHTQDRLVQVLIKSGYARRHPTGLGYDVDETSALIAADGVASQRLFALGPPTRGAFWEITAVPEIRRAARDLAERLARLYPAA